MEVIEEMPRFERLSRRDALADVVETLLEASDREMFYYELSQLKYGDDGKDYTNRDGKLPEGGRFTEYLPMQETVDARRLVVDMDTLDIFASRDHYETMMYAGRPYCLEE